MNKGFATTGILYTILIISITLMITFLMDLQNKKTILENVKGETVNAVDTKIECSYLSDELSKLQDKYKTLSQSNDELLRQLGTTTATKEDILEGKIAYSMGNLLTGVNKGYDKGYIDGQNDGYAQGYNESYKKGYNDGAAYTANLVSQIGGYKKFKYSGEVQEYKAPANGLYMIICNGAQGGSTGSQGSSITGYVKLAKDDILYLNIGGTSGYNGGGSASNGSNNGGGATDVRLNGNTLSDRIIVAGGGSGATTTYTYNYSASSWDGYPSVNTTKLYNYLRSQSTSASSNSTEINSTLGTGSNGRTENSSISTSRWEGKQETCDLTNENGGCITTKWVTTYNSSFTGYKYFYGGGGGGYYGGTASNNGSSWIDLTKVYLFDNDGNLIDYPYTGTPGQADFKSDGLTEYSTQGDGEITIAFIYPIID